MNTKHTHQFAVDAACDCGAMISEVVRKLASDKAELIAALEELMPEGWDDGTMDHMPGIKQAREALAKVKAQPMG